MLVKENSRTQVEERARAAVEMVLGWAERNKLMISRSKTNIMSLKRKLSTKRASTVKVDDSSIRYVMQTKHLGLTVKACSSYPT